MFVFEDNALFSFTQFCDRKYY